MLQRFDADLDFVVLDGDEAIAYLDAAPADDVTRLERSYSRRLRRVSRKARKTAERELLADIDDLVGTRGVGARRRISIRANRIARELAREATAKALRADAEQVAGAAFRASGNRFRAEARRSKISREQRQAGLDIDVDADVRSWKRSQVKRVRQAIEEHRQRIVQIGQDLRPGTAIETVRARVRELDGILERRLDFIARDQAQRILGEFDEKRARASGADAYRWTTQNDDDVRPEHRLREGKTFAWDKPPPDGHPGKPPNCRCRAVPTWPESKQ